MLSTVAQRTPWLTCLACILILLGLCLDQIIHFQFPELALKESVFSLTNPGHLLFGLGSGVIVLSTEIFLLERAWHIKKSSLLTSGVLVMVAVWLLTLTALVLLFALRSTSMPH